MKAIEERLALSQISADRWWEMYWASASGFPSVRELAERLGYPHSTIRKHLLRHGIAIRSKAAQCKLAYRRGRRRPVGKLAYPRKTPFPKGVQPPAFRNRSRKSKGLPTVERPCGWCGGKVYRWPSQATGAVSYCSRKCLGSGRCHLRWHADQPRPLIVEQLRVLSEKRLRSLRERNRDGTLQPPRWDQLEKLGAEIGARELELEAVLNGYVRSAL